MDVLVISPETARIHGPEEQKAEMALTEAWMTSTQPLWRSLVNDRRDRMTVQREAEGHLRSVETEADSSDGEER